MDMNILVEGATFIFKVKELCLDGDWGDCANKWVGHMEYDQ